MIKNKENAFTLVELLAVIVILAIILVIAVPKVMDVIEDAKKATLESTAKMIASAAEKAKVQNTVLSKDKEINCKDVVKLNDIDYDKCIIEFDNSGNALVTIKGKGKFSNLNVCTGDKSNAIASNDACTVSYGKASTYVEKLEAFTTNNGLIVDTTKDKNIRYAGSNPNNKVYFNCKDKDSSNIAYGSDNYDYASSCEVWRIIGVFEVDNGSGKVEKRVKLVSNVLPIYMSFDVSVNSANSGRGINQWGESTYEDGTPYEGSDLMRMLNGYYVGKESTCVYCDLDSNEICLNNCANNIESLSKISLSMIEEVLWKVASIEGNEIISLLTAYKNERKNKTSKICLPTSTYEGMSLCTDTVNRTSEWKGLVGLIYLSDYGYASADASCAIDLKGEDSTCENKNWLHPDRHFNWVISGFKGSTSAAYVWNIHSSVSLNNHIAKNVGGVRPSVYLSSSVKITGGDGGTEPYKLSL